MNARRYRLVFDTQLGALVPTAEFRAGRGKSGGQRSCETRAGAVPRAMGHALRATVLAMAAGLSALSLANPTAPTVVHGTAAFQQQGNQLTVTNSANAVINWGGFSIGQGEITRFVQPSEASRVLNRVTGQDPSQILGQLQSNGRVYLINPNGIVFGAGSRVDTAGLIASTLNLSDADFLAGRLRFTDSGSTGAVRNEGEIRTPTGGQVLLIAPDVENTGLITSPNGEIILAAGRSVELADTSNPDLRVQITAPAGQALNLGTLLAAGGDIAMHAANLRQAGTVDASSAVVEGGRVFLRASQAAIVETGSQTRADGVSSGGEVSIHADQAFVQGDISARGAQGGVIQVHGDDRVLQSGTLDASGTQAGGGQIEVTGQRIIQTEGAQLNVNGAGQAGRITVQADAMPEGRLFSSAMFSANGNTGGDVRLLGEEVVLLGAQVEATGTHGGGRILVGGGARGADAAIPNAERTRVNFSSSLNASATEQGHGGEVVVWANDTTAFYGSLVARGGAQGGNGGQLEVSAHEKYLYAGHADASAAHGQAGSLLLDPRNITIDTSAVGGNYGLVSLVDPDINAGDQFGTYVTVLGNGNIVVNESLNGPDDEGAVHLFNGTTGTLLGSIFGVEPGSEVGNGGIVTLGGGSNFLVMSPNWGNPFDGLADVGAVTWVNGSSGVSGAVSSANSLVGAAAGDQISSGGIYLLSGSANYLVHSPFWSSAAGAVTWGNGASGVSGVVSSGNSLVGSTANDNVGGAGIDMLSNGHYLVRSPNWDNGGAANAGAVTWGSGATGRTGAISSANSLVGSTAGDAIGSAGVTVLSSNNYVVRSPLWDNGAADDAGAVSWGSGTTGLNGVVSSANSLVGSTADDGVGSLALTLLPNGNYVVRTPSWDNGVETDAGMVAWGSGTAGVSGVISVANALVGATADDFVGNLAPTVLYNGNYVVNTYTWDDGGTQNVGAVTWVNGTNGQTMNASNVISFDNSLIGSTAFDQVGIGGGGGIGGVLQLDISGNYLVRSPRWINGGVARAGALTWGDASSGVAGVVSSTNSLVGSHVDDQVGGVWAPAQLSNGNYVVINPDWNNGAGSATWGDGYAGVAGVVSASNSLLGSLAGDNVSLGGVSEVGLGSSNYVVHSPAWNNERGAVTWFDGTTGLPADNTLGVVTATNSLIGTTDLDRIGSADVLVMSTGHYLVQSPKWDNGAIVDAGAVTWGNSSTGVVGTVSAGNSIVGSSAGDEIGSMFNGGMVDLFSGNFLIIATNWDNGGATDAGAVVWVNGSTGQTFTGFGAISAANALVGGNIDDHVGTGHDRLFNGNYVIMSPDWDNTPLTANDAGAVTWGNGNTGVRGVVSSTNSVVGTNPNDNIGGVSSASLAHDNYLIINPNWHFGDGAVIWIDGTSGTTGAVSATNALVGSAAGDNIGSGGVIGLNTTNDLVIVSPNWANGVENQAGAVTFMPAASGLVGTVGAGNSIVGAQALDQVGSGSIRQLGNGKYLVLSPLWDNGVVSDAGAVTWNDGSLTGAVSSINSLVGSSNFDWVGWPGYVDVLANGNYVVRSPDWDNGPLADVGAITWGSRLTGVSGVVSSTNSLIGGAAGDRVGDIGITQLSVSGNYVLEVPDWDGGKGAFAWGSGTSATTGTVSAANALVGSTAGDFVGAYMNELSDGNYVLVASAFSNGTGAVTWGDGNSGTSGVVNNTNAFIGTTAGDAIGSGGIIDLFDGRFVVQSPDYYNGVAAAGRVDIFVPSGGVPPFTNPLVFGDSPFSDSTLHPDQITAVLNTGTNVVLQANNDITINDAILANNPSGAGGNFTLQAGRSILIHADIFTDDGDLTLTANETVDVVDIYRLGGLARFAKIEIDNGATVDVGGGTASLTLRYSTEKTNDDAGSIRIKGNATLNGANISLLAEDGGISIDGVGTSINADVVSLTANLYDVSLSGATIVSPDITLSALSGDITYDSEGAAPGLLDASGTASGSITLLAAQSIYAQVIPGSSGSVSATLTGAASDITLLQPNGDLFISQYSFNAPAGSSINLLTPNDFQIDTSINLPTYHLSLESTTDGRADVTGNYNITAASLYVDANFVFDNVTSVINAPATLYGGIEVLNGGRVDLEDASEISGVWLQGAGGSGLGARLNINDSGSTLIGSTYLNNGGVLNLPVGLNSLGPDFVLDGGTLNNPNAININADYFWSAGTVAGAGSLSLAASQTLTKTGPGTVTVQQAFNNNGTVDIQEGNMVLSAGGTHDGDFDIAAGSLLTLFGTHNTDSIFSGGGQVDVTGTLNVESSAGLGEVEIGANTTFNILGGDVIGGGNLINHGTFTVGSKSVAPRLTNLGSTNLTDTVLSNGFINYGNLSLDGLVRANGSSEIAAGTVDLNAGAELSMLGAPLSWSGGTFAGTGTLSFFGGGSFNFSGNGDRVLDNPNLSFVFNTLDFPAGSLTLRAGSLTIDTGTLAANRILTLDGGTLTNNTDLTVSGTFNLFDGIYNGAGNLSTTSTGIINMPAESTVTWSNTGNLANAGILALSNTTFVGALTNASTGTMNLGPNLTLAQTVNNAGALNLVAGTTTFQNGLTQSSGSTRLNGGDLDGNVTLSGGTFGGIGTVTGDVDIYNNVTLSPGASPGTLNIIGNLTLNPLSTTLIDLGGTVQGTYYDFINVSGTATLDGALSVVLWSGYSPTVSTTFTPLMANAGITGTFATETLPNMAYSVIYNPLTVDIFYNQALAGLPPPVQTEINLAENQLGLIGVDTPWLVLSGEGAAQDPIVVCATDLSLLIAGLGEESEGGLNSLFGNLTDLARLQGWNDESRLVCR